MDATGGISRKTLDEIVADAQAARAACGDPADDPHYPPAYAGKTTTRAYLVLEGGAMRGLFTAGVLDVFLDRGLLCEHVVGVSAGALFGYNYVAGAVGRGCFINLKYCEDWRYLSVRSFVATGNVYGREFAFDEVPNRLDPFNYRAFDESPMNLVAVSSDLETGKADYHELADGASGIPYLVASSSMPLVSSIVEVDGKKLLDGGTCDSVPIAYARIAGVRQGIDKRIVVCTHHADYIRQPNKLMALMRQRYAAYPSYLDRAEARHFDYNRTYRVLKSMHADGGVFVIWPPEPVGVSNIEHDRDKLLALYEQGVETAVRAWPALERYLGA